MEHLQAAHTYLTQPKIKLSKQETYRTKTLFINELSFARIIKCMLMAMRMIKLTFMI